jgi:hypothetical protein
MSPEFIQKWETLLQDIDKNKVPIEFIKKIVLRLQGKKQRTINIERLMDQGLDPLHIEEVVSRRLIELDDLVIGIEFILNVQTIADVVQPETDRLLTGL